MLCNNVFQLAESRPLARIRFPAIVHDFAKGIWRVLWSFHAISFLQLFNDLVIAAHTWKTFVLFSIKSYRRLLRGYIYLDMELCLE